MKLSFTLFARASVLFLIVAAIGVAISNAAQPKDPTCYPGDDQCVEDAIKSLRASRDAQYAIIDENIARWTNNRKETENLYKTKLDTLKLNYSTTATLQKIKEGKLEDVAPELLSFKQTRDGSKGDQAPRSSLKELLIPSAFADTSTASIDQHTELHQKIKVYLNKKNVPFQDEDLEAIQRQVGISDYQLLVLLGIMGHESDFGNAFARTEGNRTIAADTTWGRQYHNYAGVKWCIEVPADQSVECPERTAIPDKDGFWLQKYESDKQFLITFFSQMKRGYFDKGCETPACIRQWYVGGNATKKLQWANQVGTIMQQILQTKLPHS